MREQPGRLGQPSTAVPSGRMAAERAEVVTLASVDPVDLADLADPVPATPGPTVPLRAGGMIRRRTAVVVAA